MGRRTGRAVAAIAAGALLLVGCTSGSDGSKQASPADASAAARGVTADTIKLGITYVDVKDLAKSLATLRLGEFQPAYQALVDDINAKGGINGRKLVPFFAAINPTSSAPAEAACLKLTEDEQVFMASGFFLGDSVLCETETHATAVVGGDLTAELLARAKAPWFTTNGGLDFLDTSVRSLVKGRMLAGRVAVLSDQNGAAQLKTTILPLLEKLGVDVVESAVTDAPPGDAAASQAQIRVFAERFKAKGADTVLLASNAGPTWATAMEGQPYAPKLRFLSDGIKAYVSDAQGRDLSLLDGAVVTAKYGPDEALYKEPKMQRCLAVLKKAGIETPEPATITDRSVPFTAAFTACQTMALSTALLRAAGKDLSYASLRKGADGLKVEIPGYPEPYTYGPPPAVGGNPTAYLYRWDGAKKQFARQDA